MNVLAKCEHGRGRVVDCDECWRKWNCVCAWDAYYIDGVKMCGGCRRSEKRCQCGDPLPPEEATR